MTAIEPAAPTNGLVSRQAQHVVTAPAAPPPSLGAFKPENLQIAESLARAGDMLPKGYQGKPGACLLAMDWAERNNVAILDVLAQVSFVHGKPVVGARMQKKLAARAGYRTQKVEGDERSCTVAVFGPDGVELGRSTFTFEMAERLDLVKNNPLYRKDPAQMLFHRATTRALDHYGPGELANVFADVEPDPDDASPPPAPAAPAPVDVPAVEAETAPAPTQDGGTESDLKAWLKEAGLSQGDAIRAIREQLGYDHQTLADVAADPHAVADLKDWAAQ